jgi:hypothetical protein
LCDRFLRARKFDLAKAKAMLLSAEQWRKDFGVDEIAKCVFTPPFPSTTNDCLITMALLPLGRSFEFPEKKEVNKYYPQYYHKMDKVRRDLSPRSSLD